MTQRSVPAWSQDLQLKLMAALDAAWKTIETSDDPAAVKKAREKARACGEMAAVVRKIAAMVPPRPLIAPTPDMGLDGEHDQAVPPAAVTQAQIAQRALDRLKGGRRGRI
ncbi:hypothetical protein [Caulobacter sp.]|uniref:hypothetical protein n=1 Tax=Caulobacter sp. TaxID=78 RepID=UPI003BAC6CC2